MRRVVIVLSWWVAVLGFAACAMQERAPAGRNLGRVATLDDVTNGLVSSDPAPNPLAGAFYKDGGDGDVRARTENYFATDLGTQLAEVATGQPPQPKAQRLLIQRGAIHIEVARTEDAQRAFLEKVQEWGGYLQSQ